MSAARMEEAFELEALTNDRFREQVGQLAQVRPEDRISAPGATVVMAAFTHTSRLRPSRFSDGSYGVYYAARSLKAAISETCYHRERFMRATHQPPGELGMRAYVGEVQKPLHDLRGKSFGAIRDVDNWGPAQQLGKTLRNSSSWGVLYRSVRHPKGECIGAFRPPAVSIPRQSLHLGYYWDGERIARIYHKRLLRITNRE